MVDIAPVKELVGHKNIRMTQRYAHHCPESLRDGVQVLEFGHNLVTVDYGNMAITKFPKAF